MSNSNNQCASTNWPQLTLMSKSPTSKVHHNSWLPSNFHVGASNVAHEKKINNFLNSPMSSIEISLSVRSDRFSILFFLLVGESRSLLPIYGIPRISPTSEQVIGNCLSCPMSNLQWAILKWFIIHLHKLCLSLWKRAKAIHQSQYVELYSSFHHLDHQVDV